MEREILQTKRELCVGCNKCIAKCPVKANVAYHDHGKNKVRVEQSRCILCGQCIAACDHGVRNYADDATRFLTDLANGEEIVVLAAPATRFALRDYRQILGFLRQLGVIAIYDTAIGAEIMMQAYLAMVEREPETTFVGQSCGVIVNYVQKYRPDVAANLLPLQSPMSCAASFLKKRAGVKAKIAFLSPCFGKIAEIAANEDIEYNVTFGHLQDYMEEAGVDLSQIVPADFDDHFEAGRGKLLSQPGGFRRFVQQHLPDLWIRQIEGTEASLQYLDEYAARIRRAEDVPALIDILNCQYGCNRGTGTRKEIAVDEMDARINTMKRGLEQSGSAGFSAGKSLEPLLIQMEDYSRNYEVTKRVADRVTEDGLEKVFQDLLKEKQEDREINCYACGYGNCRSFAQAVAEGMNHLNNCIDYNRKALLREKEHTIQLHKQYETFVNQAMEAIFVADKANGRVLEVNPSFLAMTGYSREEALQLTVREIIQAEDHEHEYLSALLRKRRLKARIQRIKTKSGKICEVERTAVVIQQEKGESLLFNLRDVTKQRRIERASHEALQLAGRIQKELLPPEVSNDRLEVKVIYAPAAEVSGDFLHYTWDAAGQMLRGYLFDVTGHGITTAMQTTAVRLVLDELLDQKLTDHAIREINTRLKNYLEFGTFIALLAFEFDLARGVLNLAACGINQIPVSIASRSHLLTVEGGYLGILDEPDVDIIAVPIQKGDKYYLCSDGLLDLLTLQPLPSLQNFAQTVDGLFKLAHDEQRFDDCTALCIHIKENGKFPRRYSIANPEQLAAMREDYKTITRHFASDVAFEVELVLNEAVNNGLTAGGRVSVVLRRIGPWLVMRVKDDGAGFAGNEKLREVAAPEFDGGWEEGGRGLFLMQAYCDRVLYNRRGNEVLLMKHLRENIIAHE